MPSAGQWSHFSPAGAAIYDWFCKVKFKKHRNCIHVMVCVDMFSEFVYCCCCYSHKHYNQRHQVYTYMLYPVVILNITDSCCGIVTTVDTATSCKCLSTCGTGNWWQTKLMKTVDPGRHWSLNQDLLSLFALWAHTTQQMRYYLLLCCIECEAVFGFVCELSYINVSR